MVGGGSRNELWNRIRVSVIGRKIITSKFAETTALCAAIVAFNGIGLFRTFEEARENLDYVSPTIVLETSYLPVGPEPGKKLEEEYILRP